MAFQIGLFLVLIYSSLQPLQAELLCNQEGRFASPESCRHYYECLSDSGHPIHRECPEGTIFYDTVAGCRQEDPSVTPNPCTRYPDITGQSMAEERDQTIDTTGQSITEEKGTIKPVMISSRPTVSSPLRGDRIVAEESRVEKTLHLSDQVQETSVATEVEDELPSDVQPEEASQKVSIAEMTVCDHKDAIENYVSLVTGSPPLWKTPDYQQKYNEIVDVYNNDLEKVKNSVTLWRQVNGISNGLKVFYERANEYRGEFLRKLGINREQMGRIANRSANQKYISSLEEDIKDLREGIKEAEVIIATAKVAEVREYFEGVIASKRQDIERKLQEIESQGKESSILRELKVFLEFVKDDANAVLDIGNRSKKQVRTLLSNLKNSAETFVNYVSQTDKDVANLGQENKNLHKYLTGNLTKEEELESRKEQLNQEVDDLMQSNGAISKENLMLLNKIADKREIYYKLVNALCQNNSGVLEHLIDATESIINETDACEHLLKDNNITLDINAEEEQMEENRAVSEANRKQMNLTMSEIDKIIYELEQLQPNGPIIRERLDQIRLELGNLKMFASDLLTLQNGATKATESLVTLKKEVRSLIKVFKRLTERLQSLLEQASTGGTVEEKATQITSIKKDIDDIEIYLQESDLSNLKHCS